MAVTTAQRLTVRPATVAEHDVVMTLLKERIDWLRARGSDQWSTWETWGAKIPPALERGHVWLLLDGNDPIGTVTVEFQGDRDFWTEEECTEPAAYLSKLAVRLDYAGHELGALLTDWASDYAYRRGCRYVRLDAWKTNDQLHAYYASRGWKYVRTVENPGRNSGALFQVPVGPMTRTQRSRLHDDFPITVLQPTQGGAGVTDPPDAAGNWYPDHVHRGGMTVQYDVLQRPSEAEFIDFMRYRLRKEGPAWQLEGVDRHFIDWQRQGVVLETNLQLNDELTYVVTHQELASDCRMVVTPVPPELATTCVALGTNCPQTTII
jgi:GNAT superfamily N-acetyltransferase